MERKKFMSYLDLPVIDAHIHIHTNDVNNPRVEFERHEEKVTEIFKKTNYESMVLMATGFGHDYCFEKSGRVNLIETAIGYYLKDKCPEKTYLFGGFSRNYHKPEKNTAEMLLEQAKFRVAAGCDGFKSLDGLLATYRMVGAKLSDPVTDLYYDYLEKNGIPLTIHLSGPMQVFDKNSIIYAGDDKQDEYRAIMKDMYEDVEEVLRKFPKLTLIIAHFAFLSHNLEKAEEMLTKYENLYFDMTPNIFMYEDFNKYPDSEMRAFFKRVQNKLIYGTDTFLEDGILDDPIQVQVVRGYFEKEKPELLTQMEIKTLPMDEEFLRKMYYENFIGIVGKEPRKVNYKMAIEEAEHILSDYRAWLSERDIDFLTRIKAYFENK